MCIIIATLANRQAVNVNCERVGPVSRGLIYSGGRQEIESSQLTAVGGRRITDPDPPAAVPEEFLHSYLFQQLL